MSDDQFFKERYFTELTKQLSSLQADMKEIKSKVNYMYAFAAGVGFAASFLWTGIKYLFSRASTH